MEMETFSMKIKRLRENCCFSQEVEIEFEQKKEDKTIA